MKKEESLFSFNADVFPKYKLSSLTAQKYLSVGYSGYSEGCLWNPCLLD